MRHLIILCSILCALVTVGCNTADESGNNTNNIDNANNSNNLNNTNNTNNSNSVNNTNNNDPCESVICAQNAMCEEGNCYCDTGFTGDATDTGCVQDLCFDIVCDTAHSYCQAEKGECECDSGFTGDPMVACDPNAQLHDILFVGNSLTYSAGGVNVHFDAMATKDGSSLNVSAETYGGASMQDHLDRTTTQSEITGGAWDVVIFQGASWDVTDNYANFQSAGDGLMAAAQTGNASPVLFMTWARNDSDIDSPTHGTAVIADGYNALAQRNGAQVVPVGLAFDYVRRYHPEIILFSDTVHQNLNGSYLAALCFYTFFSGNSPMGMTYEANLSGTTIDATTKQVLETAVEQTVTTFFQ